jgi:hypothetical protein
MRWLPEHLLHAADQQQRHRTHPETDAAFVTGRALQKLAPAT